MAGLTERNKTHWDSVASSYNDKNEKTTDRLIAEIRSRCDWLGVDFLDEDAADEEDDEIADADDRANEEGGDGGVIERKVVRLLDYACGPGMVSRAFAPYVSEVRGIDLSDGMVKTYNTNASNQGLSPNEMSAAIGNLLDPGDPSPVAFKGEEWYNFDLVAVGLGFHHFEDPTFAATRLAERLKPGGVLLIIDFLPHEAPGAGGQAESSDGTSANGGNAHDHGHGHGHGHSHGHAYSLFGHKEESNKGLEKVLATVAHFGFGDEAVKKIFEDAGVGKEFEFDVIAQNVVFTFHERTMTRHVFMAKGKKV